MTTFYDPDIAPAPPDWLALDLAERIRAAKNFHMQARIKASKDHAYLHVYVETQLAAGYKPGVRALHRLQGQGLSRHEAIHALGRVFWSYSRSWALPYTPEEQANLQRQINADIDALTAIPKPGS